MSKLDNLTFYSKLQDLFDSIPPQQIPGKIEEAIQFIIQNTNPNKDIREIQEGHEVLVAIKEAFEESLNKEDSWSFYLSHGQNQYCVNLKVFYNFLHDNEDIVNKLDALSDTWHILLTFDNIREFQRVQTIISNLKYTFGESVYSNW